MRGKYGQQGSGIGTLQSICKDAVYIVGKLFVGLQGSGIPVVTLHTGH